MSLYYDRDGKSIDLMEWARRFEDLDYKRVVRDETPKGDVSTVWLGLDHSFGGDKPLIFETMVFSDDPDVDGEQRRYATEAEAREGHAAVLAGLQI